MSDEEDNDVQNEEEENQNEVVDDEEEDNEVLDDDENEEENEDDNDNEEEGEEEPAVITNNDNTNKKEIVQPPKNQTNLNQQNLQLEEENNNSPKKNIQTNQKQHLNQEQGEEEYEEEERDSEILKEVTDPEVKKLIEIEVTDDNKEDVIKLLLNNQIIKKKEEIKKDENEEEAEKNKMKTLKATNRYMNTISTLKNYLSGQKQEPSFNKTDNFHIYNQENDPEFTKDFEAAKRKILEKLSNKEESNQDKDLEVYKLLFSSSKHKKNNEEMNKTNSEIIKNIGEKVKETLNKKRENLDKIASICNQEFNNKYTFAPKTNASPDAKRRKLAEFQKDQQDYLKKIKEKKENMIKQKEKAQTEEKHKPQIDKNSEKIFGKVVGKSGNETVHQRLFNKKYATAKTSLLAEKKKKQSEKEKEEQSKKKPKKNKLPWKKKENEGEEKKETQKPKNPQNIPPKHYLLKESVIPTNKIILNNFNDFFDKTQQDFYENYQKIREEEGEVENQVKNEEEAKKENEEEKKDEEKKEEEVKKENEEEKKDEEAKKEEEVKNEEEAKKENEEEKKDEELINGKLSIKQLEEFLHLLGMCSKPKMSFTSSLPNGESINRKTEINLIQSLFDSIKNESEEYVSTSNLKKFLQCVIGLQNYLIYMQYKAKNIPDKEIDEKLKETNKDYTPNDKIEYCINEMYGELEDKIDQEKSKNNKYISYSKEDNDIIIPLLKAKKIKSDFSLFSINYMEFREKQNREIKKKRMEKRKMKDPSKDNTFKPEINDKSNQLYSAFREKVLKEELDDPEQSEIKNDKHMEYIEKLIMKKNRQKLENQRLQKELEQNELKDCTFKPKIENNPNFPIPKSYGADRFNELFKKGSEFERNRKNKAQNRTQEEFDYEKNEKECTFQPNLESKEKVPEDDNLKFDVLRDKSCLLQYERLKNGKIQREIKDAVNDRYEFNLNIKEFIKKGQIKDSSIKGSNNDNGTNKKTIDYKSNDNNEKSVNETNSKNTDENNNKSSQGDGENQEEKKEGDGEDDGMDPNNGVPLLIIDVNIRAGVKKKLYVYEGMTAAYLAEKFAKEHNLEPQTQEKLKNLINSHLQRLLTRIDEEVNSVPDSAAPKSKQSDE